MNKLCECGCGQKAPVSDRTRLKKGHVKGKAMRFVHGHVHRGKVQPLELRLHKSRKQSGREPLLSPYIPDLIVKFDSVAARWRANRRRGYLHARAVWEQAHGPVPEGYCVHHKDGRHSALTDDRLSNLMLLTNEWNLDFVPNFVKYLQVSVIQVTSAYLSAEHLPYSERFSAVHQVLLQRSLLNQFLLLATPKERTQ